MKRKRKERKKAKMNWRMRKTFKIQSHLVNDRRPELKDKKNKEERKEAEKLPVMT